MTAMRRPNIPALTGFRGLAALFVLLGHGYPVVRFDNTNVIGVWLGPLAGAGMTLFFVLSGFLMWFNYGEAFRERAAGSVIYEFAVARFARLYPMFFVTLMLAIAVTPWQTLPNTKRLVAFFLMLNAWIPGSDTVPLTMTFTAAAHTWSISAEVFCYVLFPAIGLLFCSARSPRQAAILACCCWALQAALLFLIQYNIRHRNLAFVAPSLLLGELNMWIGYYSPITRVLEFTLGCFTAMCFLTDGKVRVPGWFIMLAGTAGLLGGLYCFQIRFGPMIPYTTFIIRGLLAGSTALLIYGAARHPGNWLARLLSTRPAKIGGEISYSTYLLHPFLLAGFVHPAMPQMTQVGVAEWAFTLFAALSSIYFVSYGTYLFIEVPTRRWIWAAGSLLGEGWRSRQQRGEEVPYGAGS